MEIRSATNVDAAAIAHIYNQWIEDRLATLETQTRTPEERAEWLAARGPRHLVPPATPEGQAMQDVASALFAAIERGDEEATTTEVVLHEVCYVLASKNHYGPPGRRHRRLLAPHPAHGRFPTPSRR
jgi:hypothetical protein